MMIDEIEVVFEKQPYNNSKYRKLQTFRQKNKKHTYK